MSVSIRVPVVLAFLFASAPIAVAAERVEWGRYADEGTVRVTTTNEDGTTRTTKIWLVVVDGKGYIRTGNTRWGANVERDPDLVLHVASQDLPLRVEFVTDPTTRDAVVQAFRDKYGFSDWIIGPFRRGEPKIMRLVPRGS
ncbi:MAG: DUF2255 family protein [Deltaproteobacteria bacterium]|nr:MAG: DUF2255 family protein [Deltaproteobacteria bacterium]